MPLSHATAAGPLTLPPGYRPHPSAAPRPAPRGVEQNSAKNFMRIADDPQGHWYDENCVDVTEQPVRGVYSELASCCRAIDLKTNKLGGGQRPKLCVASEHSADGEAYVRDGEASYATAQIGDAHSGRWATALAATLGRP